MVKHAPARKIVGYKVEINRTGQKGKWERVGFLFNSRGEAAEYRSRNYPSVQGARVQAIRVDCTPITLRDDGPGAGQATRAQKQAQYLAAQRRRAA